jgi:hypothetical protein
MDGALARGRTVRQRSRRIPRRNCAPTKKNLRFPELIGPLVVTAPAVLHAIFMNQTCVYVGIAGGIVKQGGTTGHHWRVRKRTGGA